MGYGKGMQVLSKQAKTHMQPDAFEPVSSGWGLSIVLSNECCLPFAVGGRITSNPIMRQNMPVAMPYPLYDVQPPDQPTAEGYHNLRGLFKRIASRLTMASSISLTSSCC